MKLKFLTAFIILFILFCIIGITWCIISERRGWNHGICPECGEKLRHFDCDSQGGDGWCCDKCRYKTWVSYKKIVYKK